MERTVKIYDPLKCRREEFSKVEDFNRFDAFLENIMKLMKYLPAEKCHTRLYLENPGSAKRYKYVTTMNEISKASELSFILLNIFDLSRGNARFKCKTREAPDKIPRWHDVLGKLKDVVLYIDQKEIFEPTDQYEDMIEHILSNKAICKSLNVINEPYYLNISLGPIPDHYTEDDVDDALEDFHDFYYENIYLLRKKFKKAIDIHKVIHLLKPVAPKEIQLSEENTVKITTDILRHVKDKESKDYGSDRDDGYKLELLGKGGYGSVSKCTFHGGITTVIKCMEFADNTRDIFYKEIGTNRLLESISHPNIIEYFTPALVFDDCGYILMEYGGVSIESRYYKHDKYEGKQMENIEILKAVKDVSGGLHYLHNLTRKRLKYVVHRDIRTANIVVNERGEYKIIDFGISSLTTVLHSRVNTDDMKLGCDYWKSPEELLHFNPDPEKVKNPGRMADIWSLGICILEMKAFPGRPNCIKENNEFKWKQNLKDKDWIRKQISNEWQEEIQIIAKLCLEYDESNRCDAEKLFHITSNNIEAAQKEEFKKDVAPGDKLTLTVLGDKQITITSDMLKKISNMTENSNEILVPSDCGCTISMIASGGFGKAVHCNYSNEVNIVIKSVKIKPETPKEEEDLKNNKNSFERELKRAIDLKNSIDVVNIVQCFLPVLVYDNTYGFTLQEYGGTSLEDLYFEKKVDGHDKKMDDKNIDKAIRDIANALNYLHSKGDNKTEYIIHRDIRAANIVVDKEGPGGLYKLIDFGISSKTTHVNSRICSRSLELGHHFWRSPEFSYHTLKEREVNTIVGLGERKKPGRKSDIWGFGIAILEMKSFPKRPEFFNFCQTRDVKSTQFMEGLLNICYLSNCNDLYEGLIKGQIDKLWKKEGNAPDIQRLIILQCLEWDEDDRWSAQDILANCE